ncbi:MAG: PKD domain-containing protein [Bacteroidia bacterium]|nr:PKD domain-containing protein [Bacteroidia bacterium]
MNKFIITVLLACTGLALHGQDNRNNWLMYWQNPAADFYTIKTSFDSAWKDTEQRMRDHSTASQQRTTDQESEKDGTYRLFKRWEWYYAPRVGASGNLSMPAYSNFNFFSYLNENTAAAAMYNASVTRQPSTTSWTFIGPTGAPQGGGAGRINVFRIDPSNPQIMYAGAPAGGLWKSTNAGANWFCLTDFLPVIGCSDLAIDPNNPNIMYLATGDQDGGDTPSIGVLKSTDGGVTWNTTGLGFNVTQSRKVARILIDPTNTNILYVGTSAGIYKSTDAGVTFSQVSGAGVQDMEMKPNDPNTIYACRTTLVRTTNGGATWTTVNNAGLPASNITSRMAIAVSKDAPDNVYLVAGKTGSYGFRGVYVSTNSGVNFTQRASSPNLLGWDPSGNDSDGQSWYDLAIAVAPYDADVVVVGGVNVWRSDDGGYNWYLNAHWYGGGGAPYVHADVHGIEFYGQAGNYYIACDGGVFHSDDDGGSFADISGDMCIAQIYKLGISASDAGTIITGHQDNGTNRKVGAVYDEVLGGDGMDCFIDRTTDNNMFGSIYYGDFYRSTNGGNNFNGITNGLSGNADWVAPWKQDPVDANTLYCGYDQVFKSTNLGNSWTQLGTLQNGSSLKEIEIAASNTDYIYTTTGYSIFRTTDGGTTWNNITGSLNTGGGSISGIAISPYDERTLWISLSGYNNNNKVYWSNDAGATWVNISNGLPNIPANCITAIPGTGNNLIFVGMDAGVYYRSDNSNGWQPYFYALPLAPISDFEYFAPSNKLRASTYGRGVWETDVDLALFTPVALFSTATPVVCTGNTVQYNDASTNNPVSWTWLFPGGTPSSSSLQNPSVTYNAPGVYPVTLIAANANGSDNNTQTAYITVTGSTPLPYSEGFTAATFLPSGWRSVNNANQSHYWERNTVTGNNSNECAYFNNFSNNTSGATDDMITPAFNLTGYQNAQLTFDVAYARYSSTRSDTLEVLVSTDCGATWSSVYSKGGTTLSTASDQTSLFTPAGNQWRNESVNLNAYSNASALLIAFRNHGHHGNALYIDNINLNANASAAPTVQFSWTSLCAGSPITFTDNSTPAVTSRTWTFQGANPSSGTQQTESVVWSTPGTYTVTLTSGNSFGTSTTQQVITVLPQPVANAGNDTSVCGDAFIQLNGTGGLLYSWQPGSALYSSTMNNPLANITATTTFSLSVTDSSGCTAQDTVRITRLNTPAFSTVTSDYSICPGDSVIIYCSTSSWLYSWNPAVAQSSTTGDTITDWPATTTTYSITATDTVSGCTGTATRNITVYPAVAAPTILIWGFSLTCSTPAASYQWYLNGNPIAGATTQNILATQIGMYQVEAFCAYGCESGISPAVLVDDIPEIGVEAFAVYPNPSNGIFNISFFGKERGDYSIEIVSVDGKIVASENLDAFQGNYSRTFDLSLYGAGIYTIRITRNGSVSAYRLITY